MAAEKRTPELEGIGIVLHVPLHLSVTLGSCTMPIAELLKLGTGSIVELDREIDHPVDLLVNGKPVARGEIVAVDNAFGLRITELIA